MPAKRPNSRRNLDVARASTMDDFSEQLAGSLATGWEGFTGTLVEERQALRHQIAQKLHAASAPGSMRAHDLIDLQLLDEAYEGDYSDVREICVRLFAYRKMQRCGYGHYPDNPATDLRIPAKQMLEESGALGSQRERQPRRGET